ncbi:hypothetical protein JS528_02160 [Bifidobacterium sp. MA2]|uniref:Signal transduction histidine kinase subgroup 3 dimerisation and phosphoacceptor domain-containing protein n=1 Tax=Bifidobacterium santillanense TaxID=2809028 RepID=A0ABS5UMN9_9BIFI|nr:histidine kinase [Bifidobacterium santillanense]MBT1172181.1 hypothetical protein [Bifidobacterium santillanense]
MTMLHTLRRGSGPHPAVTAIAVLDCVLVVVEMAANRPADPLSWLVFAVQLTVCAGLAFAPTPACALSLAICVAAAMLPGSPSFCALLAFPTLGLLAYLTSPAWTCLAAIALSLAPTGTGVSLSVGGDGSDVRMTGFTVNVVCYLIAVGVGVSLRRRSDARRERDRRAVYERSLRELEQVRRNRRLAKALHDSVTRELSSISMLAWQLGRNDDADPAVREAMDVMYRDARSALDHVHEVIDLIDGTTPDGAMPGVTGADADDEATDAARRSDPSPEAVDRMDELRRLVDAEQRSITVLGFSGTSSVHGASAVMDERTRETAFDLIREIYANIIRHAMPGDDGYMVMVDVRDGGLAITQTNTVPETAPRHPLEGVRHGLGLDAHRRAVEQLGGVLRTRCEDGEWFLHAELPLSAAG